MSCNFCSYRKAAKGSESHSQTESQAPQSLPASSSSQTTATQPSPAEASFCVETDSVNLQTGNNLCQNPNLENVTELSSGQDNSSSNVGNTYDSIDNVPAAYQNQTLLSPSSPPDAGASFSVDADNAYSLYSEPVPVNSTDDVTPTNYMSMSASSLPPRSTVPLPSSPEAAAAAVSFSADTNSVDIQTGNKLNQKPEDIDNRQNNSDGNLGNIYDSIEDVPPTYQNLSASGSQATPQDETTAAAAAAASVGVDANSVNISPDNSIKDVPCVYQIEPNTKPSGGTYANPMYDVGDSTA